jgi:uncharacterized protein (DUF362 family)
MKELDDNPENGEKSGNGFIHHRRAFSRRDFLSTLGISAAAAVIGAGCGKKNPVKTADTVVWTPPALPASSTVAVQEVTTYTRRDLVNALDVMFNDLGGLSDIVKGKTVGMKVNLTGGSGSANTTPKAVELFWTHPEVVKAVGEFVKDAGPKKIYIIEAIYDDESYNNYGFRDAATYLGATLIDLNKTAPSAAYVQRSVGGGWLIYQNLTQNGILDQCDCIISLPKAKQHQGAGVTHAMKNLVGTLPVPSGLYNAGASNRSAIHSHRKYEGNTDSNLRRVVVDLNMATKIHLAVTDAIKTASGGEGPWNRGFAPVTFNRLIASKDVVAADSIATKVIGFDPMSADGEGVFGPAGTTAGVSTYGGINYLKLASEKGMGNYDPAKILVKGVAV